MAGPVSSGRSCAGRPFRFSPPLVPPPCQASAPRHTHRSKPPRWCASIPSDSLRSEVGPDPASRCSRGSPRSERQPGQRRNCRIDRSVPRLVARGSGILRPPRNFRTTPPPSPAGTPIRTVFPAARTRALPSGPVRQAGCTTPRGSCPNRPVLGLALAKEAVARSLPARGLNVRRAPSPCTLVRDSPDRLRRLRTNRQARLLGSLGGAFLSKSNRFNPPERPPHEHVRKSLTPHHPVG